MYRVSGNLALARQYFERALELTQRVGDPAGTTFDETNVTDCLVFLGLLPEARIHIDRAMVQSKELDPDTFVRAYPPISMGRLALFSGDWDLARNNLEHALALADQSHDRQALEISHSLLADLALLEGDPETARVHVEALAMEDGAQIGVLMPALSLAYLGLGRHDDAMRTASEVVRRLTEQNERLYLVDALRAQGIAFAVLGQQGEASRVLEYGLTLARTMAYPYGEGQLLEALGTIHLQSGDPASALHRFKEALHVFTRLGSSQYIARTQTAIANLERADVTRTGNA
jgi:tetratricopeptide (TPR) repeat protein